MMLKRRWSLDNKLKRFIATFLLVALSGCIVTPTPSAAVPTSGPYSLSPADNPYEPRPLDVGLRQMGVILTSMNLAEGTDDPPHVTLTISGSLPTPCNELRVKINQPDEKYQIFVEVYGVVNQNLKCDNVLRQFDVSIVLGLYTPGRYIIFVNEQMVGDFVSN